MRTVDDADLEHWRRHGYVIVENFLDKDELDAAQENIERYMPTWPEYVRDAPRYRQMLGNNNMLATPQGWVMNAFPYTGDALNHVVLHPYLVEFAERLVGHDRLALSHAGLMGKYAGRGDYEQQLHLDYSNNTLVFPGSGMTFCDIPAIVYYTDVDEQCGPTFVVSQELTREHVLGPRHRTRDEYREWYDAEVPVVCPAGSVFIYSMRTFHRGSAMRQKEGLRWTQHLAYHTDGPRWLGSATFQRAGGSPEMDHFLVNATPRQRELVGFPAAGDPYWDDETIRGVQDRYPLMDMAPYRKIL
jgi:ectoine hydroxylase-related dioxygenase (phytanoyl-CoA dioxygenase family)